MWTIRPGIAAAERVGQGSPDPKGPRPMLSMRTVMTAAVVVAFSAGWLARTSAQQTAPAPLITYFSHENVDASFAQALASAGSTDLFARKDRQGRTCPPCGLVVKCTTRHHLVVLEGRGRQRERIADSRAS